MRSIEALATALGMLNCPQVTPRARYYPLPKGITFLLEVAAGEDEALRDAAAITERTEATLRKAAGFYIEQVLLSQDSDYFRLLGCSRKSSQSDLRRHMALIMRWLHPDIVSGEAPAQGLDKSIYANRVTKAWEAIKTGSRRATYEASLAAGMQGKERRLRPSGPPVLKAPAAENLSIVNERRRNQHLALKPVKRKELLTRLYLFFAGCL